MKQLKELTLKEFDAFKELVKDEQNNSGKIFKLFDLDINKMKVTEMMETKKAISSMPIPDKQIQSIYNINGRMFTLIAMIKDIKAGQFIDFQNQLEDVNKLFSIFLIPMKEVTKKNFWGKLKTNYVTGNYGEDYDIIEVQDYLYNNLQMADANALATFFLTLSMKSLPIIKIYLMEAEMKMRNEKLIKMQG
jgi:hypothetical protein